MALVGVLFADGFFGVLAGTKREGFKTYKDSFRWFDNNTVYNDEYLLKRGKNVITNNGTSTFEQENLVESSFNYNEKQKCNIVKPIAIERFHPNNIDNKDFWKISKDKFKYISVCGSKSKSFKEVNQLNNENDFKNYNIKAEIKKITEYQAQKAKLNALKNQLNTQFSKVFISQFEKDNF
jgi:glycerophosphoryl diester phosphodiesterase